MNKTKYIFALIFLLFLSVNFNAQKIENHKIYSIIIFEFKGNGFVKINKNGETNFGKNINIDKVNQNIFKLLESNALKKREANNNPPPAAIMPNEGFKSTYITVIFDKDFNNEKDYANKTSYISEYKNVKKDFYEYEILDLFSKK